MAIVVKATQEEAVINGRVWWMSSCVRERLQPRRPLKEGGAKTSSEGISHLQSVQHQRQKREMITVDTLARGVKEMRDVTKRA